MAARDTAARRYAEAAFEARSADFEERARRRDEELAARGSALELARADLERARSMLSERESSCAARERSLASAAQRADDRAGQCGQPRQHARQHQRNEVPPGRGAAMHGGEEALEVFVDEEEA